MKALYDAAGEGKDLFAVIDLGINPNITLPAASTVGTWSRGHDYDPDRE